jgi:hypothetical protein
MNNKIWKWIAAAVFIMIGLPWLTVTFAGPAGMALCLILFFAVDPIFCAAAGVFAGKNMGSRWALPLAPAGLFLAGVWLCFEMGEPDFLRYGAAYLVVGVVAMVLTALLHKIKK